MAGYELEFEDRFDGDALDTGRWVPHYLPQWSTPELTASDPSIKTVGQSPAYVRGYRHPEFRT